MPRTMTITQVARYLGVTRPTIYQMLKSGRFSVPPIPGTKPRRWSTEAVIEWVNQRT